MDLTSIPKSSGAYSIFDLDNIPVYVGETSELRRRFKDHFIKQDSSVTSYGRLDPWDISHVEWWTTENRYIAENQLISKFDPYLNFDTKKQKEIEDSVINIQNPDGKFSLISDEEREFRKKPYNRAKQKLEHINRMIDKIKFADHSEETRKTLYKHKEILEENLNKFLGVKE